MSSGFVSLLPSSDLTIPWDAHALLTFNQGLDNLTKTLTENLAAEERLQFSGLPFALDDPTVEVKTEDEDDIRRKSLEEESRRQDDSTSELTDHPPKGESLLTEVRAKRVPRQYQFIDQEHLRQILTPFRTFRSSASKTKTRKTKKPVKDNKKGNKAPSKDRAPVIFVPEDKGACIKTKKMSSFGFLSFAMAIANIVINIANNINNNNNNNNNNDNNNNNNDNNVNVANNNNNLNSGNEVMVGRRLERLLALQRRLSEHVASSRSRRRRTVAEDLEGGALCPGAGDDIKAEGLLAVGVLVDLWRNVIQENEVNCVGYKFCSTRRLLEDLGIIASHVGNVGTRAAARLMAASSNINEEYLVWAADKGKRDEEEEGNRGEEEDVCKRMFSECEHLI